MKIPRIYIWLLKYFKKEPSYHEGRSKVVHITKISFVLIAVFITIALIVMPITGGMNKDFRLTFSNIEKTSTDNKPTMVKPRLQGITADGQTYNISAENAVQDKKGTMSLHKITGDITLKGNNWISLTADDAFFHHESNAIDFLGNINVYTNHGYEFSTTEAYADIKKGTVYGNNEITGQGPIGHIRADSFYAEHQGQHIYLRGRVKLVLYPVR